ncbi:MAG: hypothetical protein ACYTGV_13855 [Planctomycetota bacterium]|jgi:hypothetical protein
MADGERYADVVFPEYYEDIFTEQDPDFRFRLIRRHIHPKLRALLTGCLDVVADTFETDPYTFSKLQREPKTHDGDEARLRCALYGLYPNEVRGNGYPNLRKASGRGRHLADFDLSFFVDRDGLGLELHVGRQEELRLLQEVYQTHRDKVDALLTFVRIGVDGPAECRLLSLEGMIKSSQAQAEQAAAEGWLAIFEPRYPFPIAARDFMGRFEDCFLALYLLYDAMLSHALGIEDHFEEHFARLEEHFREGARIDDEPPIF